MESQLEEKQAMISSLIKENYHMADKLQKNFTEKTKQLAESYQNNIDMLKKHQQAFKQQIIKEHLQFIKILVVTHKREKQELQGSITLLEDKISHLLSELQIKTEEITKLCSREKENMIAKDKLISHKEQEINNKSSEIEQLFRKIEELSGYRMEKEVALKESAELRKQVEDLEAKLRDQRKKMDFLIEDGIKKDSETQSRNLQLIEKGSLVSELEISLEKATKKSDKLLGELRDVRDRLEAAEVDKRQLEINNKEDRLERKCLEDTNKQLESQMVKLEEMLQNQESDLKQKEHDKIGILQGQWDNQKRNLESRLKITEEECEHRIKQLKDAEQKQKLDYEATITKYLQQIHQRSETEFNATKEMLEMKSKVDSIIREKDKLTLELKKERDDIEITRRAIEDQVKASFAQQEVRYQDEITTLKKKQAEAAERHAQSIKALTMSKGAIEDAESNRDYLEKQVAKHESTISKLSESIETLQEEKAELAEKLRYAVSMQKQSQEKEKLLQTELKKSQAKLQKIQK
jgi:hypothetical protein